MNIDIESGLKRIQEVWDEYSPPGDFGPDMETIHYKLDEIILEYVPDDIRIAYMKIKDAEGFWYA